MSGTSLVRTALRRDLPALVEIYNHYVAESHCTFDTEPFTEDGRLPWWAQFDGARYQCWVAEHNGAVEGYACTAPLKPKPAYGTSVEISVYIAPGRSRAGHGRRLYEALLPALEGHDVHRAYALIALPNDPSIALHERFGFVRVAHLNEVGRKFGRYWDVAWYQLSL